MKIALCFASILSLLCACDSSTVDVQPMQVTEDTSMSIYTLPIRDLNGTKNAMDKFAGQVTLIVNVASKCGYTPQYRDLQTLHDRYHAQGFSVVGIPSNDFGGQEPGGAAEITACALGYGADFPLMEKVGVVDAEEQSSIYRFLAEATGETPNWNFCKYLIDQNGTPVAYYGSNVEPLSQELTDRIDLILGN